MEEKVQSFHWWKRVVVNLFFLSFFFIIPTSSVTSPNSENSATNNNVQLLKTPEQVVIDNGIVNVTFTNPTGHVIGLQYNGVENVLEILNEEDERGYWDIVWNKPGSRDIFDKLPCTTFKIITETPDQVEVSFSKKWDSSMGDSILPLNIDKRYIVRRGSPGIYVYAILERLQGWPDVDMDQIRVVFKIQQKKFNYMAITDQIQRYMPMPQDRVNGQPLAYPEAVLLTKTINPDYQGEVDDKYQYALDDKDNKVHGWIADDPPIGFWMITASDEFRVGGPVKQDLTSHAGPIVMNMFTSLHYTGKELDTKYRNGEPWKKVLGPAFVYLNKVSPPDGAQALWEDAKRQMLEEIKSWPYEFAKSEDFPTSEQRGSVEGQLLVRDPFIKNLNSSAYVGLAAPGDVGSWQHEAKGYQFWTQANSQGQFVIPNVRAGSYNLYGWVPGVVGEFKHEANITITPGSKLKLGEITFEPPRNGPTLWEIGVPDRTAAGFFVPDASPTLTNKLFINIPTEKYRQYGLWERYTELYPKNDLVYDVSSSDYSKDWFFAHVTRKLGKDSYCPTTWEIIFQLDNINPQGNYTLRIALASAIGSEVVVRFNDPKAARPLFKTGLIGDDNAIARHGIHGLYRLFNIDVPSDKLVQGKNSIYLTQSRGDRALNGVMYDYIRLEGPKSA